MTVAAPDFWWILGRLRPRPRRRIVWSSKLRARAAADSPAWGLLSEWRKSGVW